VPRRRERNLKANSDGFKTIGREESFSGTCLDNGEGDCRFKRGGSGFFWKQISRRHNMGRTSWALETGRDCSDRNLKTTIEGRKKERITQRGEKNRECYVKKYNRRRSGEKIAAKKHLAKQQTVARQFNES